MTAPQGQRWPYNARSTATVAPRDTYDVDDDFCDFVPGQDNADAFDTNRPVGCRRPTETDPDDVGSVFDAANSRIQRGVSTPRFASAATRARAAASRTARDAFAPATPATPLSGDTPAGAHAVSLTAH